MEAVFNKKSLWFKDTIANGKQRIVVIEHDNFLYKCFEKAINENFSDPVFRLWQKLMLDYRHNKKWTADQVLYAYFKIAIKELMGAEHITLKKHCQYYRVRTNFWTDVDYAVSMFHGIHQQLSGHGADVVLEELYNSKSKQNV